MAARFSITVVAEGIEDPLQLRSLRAGGGGSGQGYLLARPASAEAILPMITGGMVPVEKLVAEAAELLN